MAKKETNFVPIYTRIPRWLYDKVHEAAKVNRRPLTAEIAIALEQRFGESPTASK
jgi:hypothetical protein